VRFPAPILAAVQERREPIAQPWLLATESRGQPVPLRLGEEVGLPVTGDHELSTGVIRHDLRTAQSAAFFQLDELEPFVGELERLDRDLVLRGVELGELPFRRPRLAEPPAENRLAGVV
jgi:hypothetical protein